jgi:hypothetical protein
LRHTPSRRAATWVRVWTAACSPPLLLFAHASFAIDSYRYLHVSIETPWMIFLFLCVAIFVPFILMIALMWTRQFTKPAPKAVAKAAPPNAPNAPTATPPPVVPAAVAPPPVLSSKPESKHD